jgi:hypothetical protein
MKNKKKKGEELEEGEVGTQQNPLEVEVIDLMRFQQPKDQSIFITAHLVPELYNIAKERRKASLILIDDGVRYSLKSVQVRRIETDGAGRMKCHYVNVSLSDSPT